MWKDFFYFSKSQRFGVIILLMLIVIVVVLNYFLPIILPDKELKKSNFIDEVKEFEISLVARDSIQRLKWQHAYELRQAEYLNKYKNADYSNVKQNKTEKILFSFDPNSLDSIGLIKLGLKTYAVSNILKYRKSGGVFKSANDFSKVYGISNDQFLELKEYIMIAELKKEKNDTIIKQKIVNEQTFYVELNSADTVELMKIRGIGRGYANGIIKFRKLTGGFVSVEQLNEIYGMNEKNFNLIKPYCKVNINLVTKINVNTASIDRLNFHPYISFYQAKAIYEFRRRKGKLKSIEELRELTELNSEAINKIKPYLNFE